MIFNKNFVLFAIFILSFVKIAYSKELNNYDNSIASLKEIAGYSNATSSFIMLNEEEVINEALGDLIKELRPFLKEAIDEKFDDDHSFTNKEALSIISKHPIKFFTALFNYVLYSIEEIFNIASENATVVG